MSSKQAQLVSFQTNRPISEPKILKHRQISLGKLMRMYRERNGQLSREVLASLVGVSSRTIRNWENDISLPTSHHLRKLIEIYAVQNLFLANEEREEAQELWLKRQEQDEINTFPGFDENWFSRMLQAGRVVSPPSSNPNRAETVAKMTTVKATDRPGSLREEKPAPPPNNLPTLSGPTIGRESELAQLQALLQNPGVRLLTLVGPGGVGKTRLGLQVSHEVLDKFADGVFFVCLAAIQEPALVLEMIAQTLGVNEASGPNRGQSLQTFLASRQILLFIDNFEQVKNTTLQLLSLLKAAPGLKLLVGSRITLQIADEQVFDVAPLALPPLLPSEPVTAPEKAALVLSEYGAGRLLLQRALAAKPDLKITAENEAALLRICQRLDGLPLALELAAARLKYFTPPALLKRLEGANNSSPLQLLEKSGSRGPGRQQSLRQTLDWSYNLLASDEQQLFCSLAIFTDGCALTAGEAVCARLEAAPGPIEPGRILNLLTQLVEKSLLRYENDPDGEPRFMMLQTVREYAMERLKAANLAPVLWQRYSDYFVKLAETAEAFSHEPEQTIWTARLEKEHNNLRAVLHHALENSAFEIALRLVASLCPFWERRGYRSEGLRWADETLAKTEALRNNPAVEKWRAQAFDRARTLALYHDQHPKG